MAIDPSIILQAGQGSGAPVPLSTMYQQAAQIRAANDQSQLQAVSLSRLTRQDAADAQALDVRRRAGAAYAAGDVSGATNLAASSGNFDLVKQLGQMTDEQRARAHSIAGATAPVFAQLKAVPPALRKGALMNARPDLIAAGLPADKIDTFDPTDQNIDQMVAHAQTIDEYQKQANADRTAKLEQDKFGHTVQHDAETTATTRRGQDLTHGDAAAERAVQIRGQDKPVSVGFGNSLVSPTSGKVVYGGLNAGGAGGSLDAQAKAIAEYRLAPPTGRAAVSGPGAAIMDRVTQLNPTYDGTRFHERSAAVNAFGAGKLGSQTRSLSVAVDHLDMVSAAATALKNGNLKLFNGIANGIASSTGGTAPTNFAALKDFVMDETTKAIVGSGGGVGDRDKAQAILGSASSPDQLAGAVQKVQGLMAGQLHGLQRQYETSTGLKNFGDMVSPRAKQVLQGAAVVPTHADGTAVPADIAAILARHGRK